MRVSVIVPAYNAASFVERALDTLAQQTYAAHEVLVSDDGSKDNTAEVVRAWAAANPQVKVRLIQGPNGGIAVARNRALRVAEGELISLLDADDEMLPQQLECLVAGFKNFPDAAVVFGDVLQKFDDTGREEPGVVGKNMVGTSTPMAFPNWLRFDKVFDVTLSANRVPNQCTLMSKRALQACGGWDDAFRAVEDRELFLRLSAHGGFYFFAQVLAVKHEREASVSNNLFVMSMYQFRVLLKAATYAADQPEVQRVLPLVAAGYLYRASEKGLSQFRTARRELRSAQIKVSAFQRLKAWARVLKVSAQRALSAGAH